MDSIQETKTVHQLLVTNSLSCMSHITKSGKGECYIIKQQLGQRSEKGTFFNTGKFSD